MAKYASRKDRERGMRVCGSLNKNGKKMIRVLLNFPYC